nr:hypothetical protein [uncultured Lichenicoccus sp.]
MQITPIQSQPVRAASSAGPQAAAPLSAAKADAVPVIAAGTLTPQRVLNPDMHLDPSLGIVVTEYFNQHGDETQQFPTEKAIERYQQFGMAGPGAASG